jgi:FemAB-related protein (PEP-CTERM system-associated)
MLIRPLNLNAQNDRLKWDRYVLDHPDGSAYQLTAWQAAVERAYGFSCFYFLAEDGGAIQGILPLVEHSVPLLGKSLISLPYCDAGGVLANDESTTEALLKHAQVFSSERGSKLKVHSYHPLPLPDNGNSNKVRMLLDLPENAEQLMAGLKSKVRSQARKPQRDGLTAKLGGAELCESFYRVFSRNMRDLGSPVHSRQWIETIVREYGEKARLCVVHTPDGEAAAAGLILLHSRTVSIPWASSLRRYNPLNPNMHLYWTFLSFAADHGYERFDFGRSTPGEGTYRFKVQWGAEPHPLYWYDASEQKTKNDSLSRKREIAAAVWSRLPLTSATFLGARLRKYISL